MSVTTASQSPENDPLKVLENLASATAALGGKAGGSEAVFIPVEALHDGLRAANAIVQSLGLFALIFARGIIAPFEVIARFQIGERYMGVGGLGAAIGLIAATWYAGFFTTVTAIVIGVVYLTGRGAHLLTCFVRDRRGGYWHSYSEGISFFRIGPADRFFHRKLFTFDFSKLILEPVILLCVALIIYLATGSSGHYIDGIFGRERLPVHPLVIYLGVMGVTLALYQTYCWHRRRQVILNEKDARVLLAVKQFAKQETDTPKILSYCGVAFAPRFTKTAWSK